MKGFLLSLNVLIFVCIALLVTVHVRHRSPPPPAILASRPTQPSINPAGLLSWRDERSKADIAAISQADLFDPNRGQVEVAPEKTSVVNEAQRKKLEQFELVGLVRMGSTMHGAIIHDRTGKLKKRFFKVGGKDDIEGFKLISVDPTACTATLGAGGREYELKLERNSKGSEQRRAQAQRQEAIVTLDSTAQPPQAVGQQPGRPGQPGAVTIPPTPANRQAAIDEMRKRMEAQRRERAAREAGQDEKLNQNRLKGLPPGLSRSINNDKPEAPRK
jgi:hypothetical protein